MSQGVMLTGVIDRLRVDASKARDRIVLFEEDLAQLDARRSELSTDLDKMRKLVAEYEAAIEKLKETA